MERPSWDEYFMEMAALISKRSTCMRRHGFEGSISEAHFVRIGFSEIFQVISLLRVHDTHMTITNRLKTLRALILNR